MKFGIKQLFQQTPPLMANIGHALIAATSTITLTDFSSFPNLKIAIQLGGIAGYFFVNLFGKNNNI